jgi:hypothetical protein
MVAFDGIDRGAVGTASPIDGYWHQRLLALSIP